MCRRIIDHSKMQLEVRQTWRISKRWSQQQTRSVTSCNVEKLNMFKRRVYRAGLHTLLTSTIFQIEVGVQSVPPDRGSDQVAGIGCGNGGEAKVFLSSSHVSSPVQTDVHIHLSTFNRPTRLGRCSRS
jgi:hypothetical protein